jgi:hypothetical protein
MTAEGWAYIQSTEFKSVQAAVEASFTADPHPGDGHTVNEMIDLLRRVATSLPNKVAGKVYYGPVSGAMSRLAKEGVLTRLKEKRGGHSVYVLTEQVNGRETVQPKAKQSAPEAVVTVPEDYETLKAAARDLVDVWDRHNLSRRADILNHQVRALRELSK